MKIATTRAGLPVNLVPFIDTWQTLCEGCLWTVTTYGKSAAIVQAQNHARVCCEGNGTGASTRP